MKIVVAGALANKVGNAGGAWERFSFAVGFQRLGHEVLFIEQLDQPSSEARDWFEDCAAWFGVPSRLIGANDRIDAADLLVNLSGQVTNPHVHDGCRTRVFVDLDPGFTQHWHRDGLAVIPHHDHYFTLGVRIGTPGCTIPDCGLPWQPLRQPVVLDQWPRYGRGKAPGFCTISTWRAGFGAVGGLPLKHQEFRRYIDLPQRVPALFSLILDIHPADDADLTALRIAGWHVSRPQDVIFRPDSFRTYIQLLHAEFSVAHVVYHDSGWFSDRSVRFLASGKPVLVQETNAGPFGGEGVVTFRTLDEAVAGAESILNNYRMHNHAARRIAETMFASEIALKPLLEAA